ncbi:DNA primase [compost metagenome]
MQLIARWHGTEQGRLLRALAEKEWLISADNLEQQFFDTITRLAASQRERSLEQLLRKARQSELSAEEKERLRDLLSRPATPVAPTSSGA